jgi:predicted nuclease with RNAse H fold
MLQLQRLHGLHGCLLDQNDMPGNGSTFRHVSKIEIGPIRLYPIRFWPACTAGMHRVSRSARHGRFEKAGIRVVEVHQSTVSGAMPVQRPVLLARPVSRGELHAQSDFCVARVSHGLEPGRAYLSHEGVGFRLIEKLTEDKGEGSLFQDYRLVQS